MLSCRLRAASIDTKVVMTPDDVDLLFSCLAQAGHPALQLVFQRFAVVASTLHMAASTDSR